MTPFDTVTAPALWLPEDRVDTDILYPARFLLVMEKRGLGRYLCYDRRFTRDGVAIPNPFDAPGTPPQILLAGQDFGSGSSREQAVWALADFGFRCVVAESLGEIFAANCLRNGVLATTLPRPALERLAALAADGPLTVDLPAQRIGRDGAWTDFPIPAAAKERLLGGWDEIEHIMRTARDDLAAFEQRQRAAQPWLYEGEPA
jgi:3-isopropylmalate/(R)-2-methylmalate dehydratase small subunit